MFQVEIHSFLSCYVFYNLCDFFFKLVLVTNIHTSDCVVLGLPQSRCLEPAHRPHNNTK